MGIYRLLKVVGTVGGVIAAYKTLIGDVPAVDLILIGLGALVFIAVEGGYRGTWFNGTVGSVA